jgi:casein kinase II subunit alpha
MDLSGSGEGNDEAVADDSDHATIAYRFGNIDHYSLGRRLGRGKYSNVFRGHHLDGSLRIIKVLKPVRLSKINREISILHHLRGAPHVCQLLDVVQDPDSKSIALVLSWSENQPVRDILMEMTKSDIAIYVRGVLQALAFAHARGIMHRDIKPGNIMFDMETKSVTLIDWGLGEHYHPGTEYHVRVATRNYKGPELLLNYGQYEPSLDIWSLGCTFAGLLFRKIPFFKAREDSEEIVALGDVVGARAILEYVEKYELEMSARVATKISKKLRKQWGYWVNPGNEHIATPDALDLLDHMLKVDHAARISASDALRHPFFSCIAD